MTERSDRLANMTDDDLYEYAEEWQDRAQDEFDDLRGENPDPGPLEEANVQLRLAWVELDRRKISRPPR